MKPSRKLAAAFLYAWLLALVSAPVAQAQLNAEAQFDLWGVQLVEALEAKDYEKSLELIEKLRATGMPVGISILFQEAISRRETHSPRKAKELLEEYVNTVGREGKFYTDALGILSGIDIEIREAEERSKDCGVCPEMVVVPAGSFMMGSPESESKGFSDERPEHRVTIGQAFAIGKYEVTFAEFDACVDAGGCDHGPKHWRGSQILLRSRIWRFLERTDLPVIDVSWDDAQQYVRWLSRMTGADYRLPSAAEWEYAARAGTTTARYWGENIGENRANCDGCGSRWDKQRTAPVGSFEPNAFGLYDVLGNVWEWTQDCWHGSYKGAPSDGSAWTAGGDCSRRVLRGGSWILFPRDVRSANRHRKTTDFRFNNIGFRVAKTFTP